MQELFGRGSGDAMLIVFADNLPAQQPHATLGFAAHCRYCAGSALQRNA